MLRADFPTGLAALAERYDAFIFDLWGVLHDGVHLYPEAMVALQALRAARKKVGIISNSPRPAAFAAENIAQKFGLTRAHYDVLMTSGELAYEALRDRPDEALQQMGTRCITIGPQHETAPYLALGLQAVTEPADADFVLCTGLTPGKDRLEAYHAAMQQWLTQGLTFFCANPDRVVMKQGVLNIAGGALAEAYQLMGGKMRDDFGKPYPDVFNRTLEALAVPRARAVMIGDNLQTDIIGANGVNLPCLWITGGVHAPELEQLNIAKREQLHVYIDAKRLHVTHILPQVRW